MASQGPNGAGSASNVAVSGLAWTNPSNVTANDSTAATRSLDAGQTSDRINATSFGFSIPSGATIDGVKATMVAKLSGGGGFPRATSVFLLKASTLTGSGKTSGFLTASYADYDMGGATDLWSATLSDSDVNDSGFGVSIRCENVAGGTEVVSVDYLSITVYYTESAGGPSIAAVRHHQIQQGYA